MSLPQIQFAEKDAAVVAQRIINRHEALTGLTLADGDPVRLLLLSVALYIVQQRVLIDYTGKQNLLYYADDDFLDHIGLPTDTPRLEASQAVATQRFTLAVTQIAVVTIPSGTRVTPDGRLFFETTASAEITAGELEVDVPITCQSAGSAGNGYVAGQINKLVDRAGDLGLIDTTENITATAGGADAEEDEPYRERIQWSPEKFSCAGPRGAYRYWAKSVSQTIVDVQVYSPQPGQAAVVLLLEDGQLPSDELKAAVLAVLNPEDMRPLCDEVLVQSPGVVEYEIDATYYITTANQSLAAAIQAAVAAAVDAYQAWQRAKLGRDIDPAQLIHLVKQAGAGKIELDDPAYVEIENWQIAQCTAVSITYGGLIDG